jgi:hypothetical protein
VNAASSAASTSRRGPAAMKVATAVASCAAASRLHTRALPVRASELTGEPAGSNHTPRTARARSFSKRPDIARLSKFETEPRIVSGAHRHALSALNSAAAAR